MCYVHAYMLFDLSVIIIGNRFSILKIKKILLKIVSKNRHIVCIYSKRIGILIEKLLRNKPSQKVYKLVHNFKIKIKLFNVYVNYFPPIGQIAYEISAFAVPFKYILKVRIFSADIIYPGVQYYLG